MFEKSAFFNGLSNKSFENIPLACENCRSMKSWIFIAGFLVWNCLQTKSFLVLQFLKPDAQTAEPHTKSAKP